MRHSSVRLRLLVSLIIGIVLAAVISALSPQGAFLQGWLAASTLLCPAVFALLTVWSWAGAGKVLGWMVALAFLLRLGLGIGLSLALPVYGYDEPTQKAGYLFYDAYMRDDQAFELAQLKHSLMESFGQDFFADQYGGLLALSAIIYRLLSLDAHRPFLILILGAFMAALGLPFFWRAIHQRWGQGVALLAAWIYVLYPDGILYGSSQLREPFLVGLIAIAFWGVLNWQQSRRTAIIASIASLAGMALLSTMVAAAAFAVLAVWFWLDRYASIPRRWQVFGWVVFGMGGAVMVFLSARWLNNSSQWESIMTEAGSGWVAKLLEEINETLRVPFIAGYGLAQPVLPAALTEPAAPIWQGIAIWRALGWYVLIPMLAYGFIAVWRAQPRSDRLVLIWLAVFLALWVVISAVRAGGDMWDNPRYRTIFLPWMALLCAWGVQWARQHKDAWMRRIILLEGIFVAVFTSWYVSRYFRLYKKLFFWQNVVVIVILAALVIILGFIWDRWRTHRTTPPHLKP